MSADAASNVEPGTALESVRLEDYEPPVFLIDRARLRVELDMPVTRVTASLDFRAADGVSGKDMLLDGDGLKLVELMLDGAPLLVDRYDLTPAGLVITEMPASGILGLTVDIEPARDVEGLVWLDGIFATSCEPEGFRKICFFPDRPDVLTRFQIELVADPVLYPCLLANGHLTEQGALGDGRHFARWEDPWPKASYLVAIVAGDLDHIEDSFTTASGRPVSLKVHAPKDELRFCREGLESLKLAMAWDEREFGREYDLDLLNIAVVRSYPGGAMEKGTNIYATEFFLASEEISTDAQRFRTRATIGHEYFHNWSGNRIGCRDWFQLSLKEGLTVYRQQQFMQAMTSEAEARIDDVIRLREIQFREDDGDLAHAIQPEVYATPNNLYTRTVYDKGAELVHMLGVIVGKTRLHAAISAFFDRYDGEATTIEAFLSTIEDETSADLTQFRRWYRSVGRVEVNVSESFDEAAGHYALTLEQSEQSMPLVIPVRAALLGPEGTVGPERVLILGDGRETFRFEDVAERPTVSLFRGYSAPVRCVTPIEPAALARLARHDTDPVNRWDSAQQLAALAILPGSARCVAREEWFALFDHLLANHLEPGVVGRLLQLPGERQLGQAQPVIDVEGLGRERDALAIEIADKFRERLRDMHDALAKDDDPGSRRLRNLCLGYLMQAPAPIDLRRCRLQLADATGMENASAALRLLIDAGGDWREDALLDVEMRWSAVPAMMDRWFALQAESSTADVPMLVRKLTAHPAYALGNATRVKAVFDTFTANQRGFHEGAGRGYAVVADTIRQLDGHNARLAARFLKPFGEWKRLPAERGAMMRAVCSELLSEGASRDVGDLAQRILDGV